MATATLAFDILTRYRDTGADKAARDLDKLGKSGTRMGTALKRGAAVGALALAGGVALAARSLVGMTQGAIEDEAAQKRLGLALHKNAGATKGQVSAVESWITAQGKALGVTDDELRPALGSLITATHDVGRAQKLAALAMDASAGSGKSLKVVTDAMTKAENGNVGALAKLKINTKNAKGETISMHEAVKRMSATFGGQASKNANTLDGKMRRLRVQWDEAKESIGARLIPVLTRLSGWILSKGVPAVTSFANEMRNGEGAAGVLGAALKRAGEIVKSAAGFLNEHRAVVVAIIATYAAWKVATIALNVVSAIQLLLLKAQTQGTIQYAVVSKTAAVATKVWAAGQWLLNAALTANPIGLIVVAIAALAAGVIYAYTHFDGFRRVVDKTFSFMKSAVVATINFVKNHWLLIGTVLLGPLFYVGVQVVKHWGKIEGAFMGGVRAVIGFVKNNWQSILATLIAGPFGLAVSLVVKHWGQIRGAVSNGVSRVVGLVRSLPGKIIAALGSLGSLLYNAGQAVIQGLIDGVTSKISALTSKLHSITSLIPKHKGPIDKDRKLLRPAGIAIMDGLIAGLQDGKQKLASVLEKVTDQVKRSGDKLKGLISERNSFVEGFRGFSSSVFGKDFTDPETGANTATAAGLVAAQAQERAKALGLETDVKRLVKMGLSSDLIRQLQASGESGIANIHALAMGSVSEVKQFNDLNKQTAASLTAAGMGAGNALYGGAIRDASKEQRQADRILKGLRELVHELHKDPGKVEVIVRTPSGREIQRQLLEIKRQSGQGLGLS